MTGRMPSVTAAIRTAANRAVANRTATNRAVAIRTATTPETPHRCTPVPLPFPLTLPLAHPTPRATRVRRSPR